MTLPELKESLVNKRNSGHNVISEFNELKRNAELLAELSNKFYFIDNTNLGQLLMNKKKRGHRGPLF